MFVDTWSPTPEEWHEATLEEKQALIDYTIRVATSDSQFALKLKKALAVIITAGLEPELP